MKLLLLNMNSGDEAAPAGDADSSSLQDSRVLFELAELFENNGLHDDAGAIDALGADLTGAELGAEFCRLGVRAISVLDGIAVVDQRQCLEALWVAESLFRRALELEGDHHQAAYRNLALVLLNLGRAGDAVVISRDWMAELITGRVESKALSGAFFGLGVAQVFSGVPVDAVFTFSRALGSVGGGGHTLLRFGLALAYLAVGDASRFEREREAVSWDDCGLSGVLERLRSRQQFNYGDLAYQVGVLSNERYASLFKIM